MQQTIIRSDQPVPAGFFMYTAVLTVFVFNGGIWLDRMRASDGSYSALYLPASGTYIGSAKLSGASSGNPFAGDNYFSATVGGKPFVFGSYDVSHAPYQVATIFSSVL